MFVGKYNRSVILTYAGVAVSVAGIFLAIENRIGLAMSCLIVAGICDLFDGKIARMCKRTEEEKSFGVQIDSLADMVNFVVFPVIIAYALGLTSWVHIVIYILFTLCAISRLGFFNITVIGKTQEEPLTHYSGLPVTYGALIFPFVWLLSFYIPPTVFKPVYASGVALVALFFVLNIKIVKPKGVAYAVFSVMALSMIAFIVFKGAW